MKSHDMSIVVMPPLNTSVPPLGAAYIHSALKRAGIASRLLDFSPSHSTVYSEPTNRALASDTSEHEKLFPRWMAEVVATGARHVGFSTWVSNASTTKAFSTYLRRHHPEIVQIFGGPECYRENMAEMTRYGDYCIFNEGEHAIVELFTALRDGRSFQHVPNVYYRRDDRLLFTSETEGLANLDELPTPDFSDLDLRAYRDGPLEFRVPIQLARGCIGQCSFCLLKRYHRTQRCRSGASVFEEIVHQKEVFGTNKFSFVDDSFISKITVSSIAEMCTLLIKNGTGIDWLTQATRVDRLLLDDGFVQLLHGSGLREITLGVESFSDDVLRHMRKGSSGELARACIRNLRRQGIRVNLYIIYGYPVETDADFARTLDSLLELQDSLNYIVCNAFGPTDGYHAWANRKKTGQVVQDQAHEHFWHSASVTLPTRKRRFFALLETLDALKSRVPGLGYLVGDPLHLRYLGARDEAELLRLEERWDGLEQAFQARASRSVETLPQPPSC